MRRGARGCAATATRTLRDFITAVFRLICSIASGARLRSFSIASARSAVSAGSAALEWSGEVATAPDVVPESTSMPVSDWGSAGIMSPADEAPSGLRSFPREPALSSPDIPGGGSSRHAQRSLNRFHYLRIHFCARLQHTKFIVKNLPHQRRVTKDASSHGHRDRSGLVFRKLATRHDQSHLGKLTTSIRENSPGQLILTGRNRRKQCREVRRRN